jgi:hypothetical protein
MVFEFWHEKKIAPVTIIALQKVKFRNLILKSRAFLLSHIADFDQFGGQDISGTLIEPPPPCRVLFSNSITVTRGLAQPMTVNRKVRAQIPKNILPVRVIFNSSFRLAPCIDIGIPRRQLDYRVSTRKGSICGSESPTPM